MCTLGTKKLNNKFWIFKNRDREYYIDTKVKVEKGCVKKLLIVDQRGHAEGLNEYGLGFVSATLQPFPRVRHKTSSQIARRILDQKDLAGALAVIKNNKISANIILSDGHAAYLVERTPYQFAATQVKDSGVLTNLSVKLDKRNGSRLAVVREWATARYRRAKIIVKDIKSRAGIIRFLSDKQGWPNKSICSGGDWWIATKCSYIYDLGRRTIYFCPTRPDKGKFKKYKLVL